MLRFGLKTNLNIKCLLVQFEDVVVSVCVCDERSSINSLRQKWTREMVLMEMCLC